MHLMKPYNAAENIVYRTKNEETPLDDKII